MSFCKKNTFDEVSPTFLERLMNKSQYVDELKSVETWMRKHTLNRSETIVYLSQQGILKEDFPCNIATGKMEGLPCIFPFREYTNGILNKKCSLQTVVKPYCQGRIYENLTRGHER